jgi:tetratricopeptide (TPR) repeat protein
VDLYKEGAYDAALVEFRKANELAPSYRLLFNIGQACFQMRDYVCALQSFERYLGEGGKEIEVARKAEIEKDLPTLRGRVGTIDFQITVPDAEVFVDGRSIGRTPLAQPVLVNAGVRRVRAVFPNQTTDERTLEVPGAEKVSVRLEPFAASPAVSSDKPLALLPPAAILPPTHATVPLTEPRESTRSIPWVGWAATGALATGALISGVLALGSSSEVKDYQNSPAATRAELDDASKRTRTLALVTDLLGGAALVAGGVSLYFTLRSGAERQAPAPTVLRLDLGPGSTGVSGTF